MEITLEMYKKLDPGKIRDFCLISDIHDILPRGFLHYWDTDGKFLAEFAGISQGSTVSIKVTGEDDDEDTEVEFLEMAVQDVTLEDSADSSTLSGNLIISFVHPWMFLMDTSCHAYEALNGTDLIKKVLADGNRGREWPVKDENFSKTDDNGSYSRYKDEGDLDFLVEKVLPYCSIDQRPAHLYCDEFGDFWLKSFTDLYRENPKVILGPKPEDMALQSVGKQVEKSMKDNGIDEKDVYSMDKIGILIAGEEMIPELYPSFTVENANSGGTASAGKLPGNMLRSNQDGKTFGGYLPYSGMMMSQSTGTSMKIVQNRSLVDSFILLFAAASKLDYSFRMIVELNFLADRIRVGNTVDLILPEVVYSDEGEMKAPGKYLHWITGKWLVTRTEHAVKTGQQTMLTTNLHLARPAFTGREKDTSLVNIPMLLEVK